MNGPDDVCEWCGSRNTLTRINDLLFCRDHVRAGIGFVIRLVAHAGGATADVIRHAGDWAIDQYDDMIREIADHDIERRITKWEIERRLQEDQ